MDRQNGDRMLISDRKKRLATMTRLNLGEHQPSANVASGSIRDQSVQIREEIVRNEMLLQG